MSSAFRLVSGHTSYSMDALVHESSNLHTTDARPNDELQTVKHIRQAIINSEVLKQIELELEEFEKIGIIFLLAAEVPASYGSVLQLCKNIKNCPHIITEWIQNNAEISSDKLIEAIAVIGNYEILENLGFPEPLVLANRYLPNVPRYTVKLNEATKVLYKLFETLDNEKTQLLLQRVYQEGLIIKQLESRYLELHALYWLQERYITISSGGGANFTNLHKHIKQLDIYSESIYHDVEHFCRNAQNSIDFTSREEPVSTKLLELTPNTGVSIEAQKDMQVIKMGLCVIINEVEFERPYKWRDGSNSDVENLSRTFRRRNFDIWTRSNLTRDQILGLFREVSETFDEEKYDCLVVCILSHGYEGGIITCDGGEIHMKDIDDEVCTWRLRNIIKILIVQACQGTKIGKVSGNTETSPVETDGPRDLGSIAFLDDPEKNLTTDAPTEDILRYSNFFQFMSTMDRFVSIRHKILGSWFIKAVCDELSRDGMISLADWATRVTANVQRNKGQVDGVLTASQIPQATSRLSTNVHFPPCVDN